METNVKIMSFVVTVVVIYPNFYDPHELLIFLGRPKRCPSSNALAVINPGTIFVRHMHVKMLRLDGVRNPSPQIQERAISLNAEYFPDGCVFYIPMNVDDY